MCWVHAGVNSGLLKERWPLQWQRGDPILVVSHLVVSGFVCRLGLLLVCKCSYMAESRPFAAVAFFCQSWLHFLCPCQVNSQLLKSHSFGTILLHIYLFIISVGLSQYPEKSLVSFQAQSVLLLCSCFSSLS